MNPAAEELAAARRGAVVLDRSRASRVRVRGRDAREFLHRISTQDIRALEPGHGATACLTDHKARIIAWGTVLRVGEDEFLWLLDPGSGKPAATWMRRYALSDDVEVEDVTGSTGQLHLAGPRAGERIADLWGPFAAELSPGRLLEVSAGRTRALLLGGGSPRRGGWRLVVPFPDPDPALARGLVPAGDAVWEVLRIEACVPAQGREITGEENPWEVGLDESVSLDKGCYTGQETLNRLRTYGGVRRRLAVLEFAEEQPPRDPRITSSASAAGEGRSVALAWLDTGSGEPGSSVVLGGESGIVRARAE